MAIDLGTARCAVACCTSAVPASILFGNGKPCEPTAVSFLPNGVRFGVEALGHATTDPDRTVLGAKRLLGRRFADPIVQAVSQRVGYELRAAADGSLVLAMGDRTRTAEDVVAEMFGHLANAATPVLGTRPTGVVLCIPCWFDTAQRNALARSAGTAGLHVDCVLPCTVAAAASLTPSGSSLQRIAVVDVGAGGVEASVLSMLPGQIEVLGLSGNGQLGGDDIDARLVALAVKQLAPQVGLVPSDKATFERLRRVCESMKCELDNVQSTRRNIAFIPSRHPTDPAPSVVLDQAQLETAMVDLLDQIDRCCENALTAAGLRRQDLNAVYVIGGLARLPFVAQRIERHFGQAVDARLGADGTPALGAARLAGALDKRTNPIEIRYAARQRSMGPQSGEPASLRQPISLPFASQDPRAQAPRSSRFVNHEPPSQVPRSSPFASQGPPSQAPRSSPFASQGPPSRAPHSSPFASQGPPAPGLRTNGELRNPQDLAGLLAMPVKGPLRPETIEHPPLVVLLLRMVARSNVTGTLHLSFGRKSAALYVQEGRPYLKKSEIAALVQAFLAAELTYSFDSSPPQIGDRERLGMSQLVMEGLRAVCRTATMAELSDVLGDRMGLSAVLRPDQASQLGKLRLSGAESRLVNYELDGTRSARDLAAHGGNGHTTLQVLLLLTLLDYVEWKTPAPVKGTTLADEIERRATQVEHSNHFEALGVHWSATTDEIEAARRKIRDQARSDGDWAKVAPAACQRIIARAELAYTALREPRARMLYRRETYPDLDFDALDDLLGKRAQALEMKQDKRELAQTQGMRVELDLTSKVRHSLPTSSTKPPGTSR